MYREVSTVLTGSKEIYPNVFQDKGFVFEYTDIEVALEHELSWKNKCLHVKNSRKMNHPTIELCMYNMQ